ncbi:MAG: hypothetical protein U1E15_06540 [Hyphomicrobiales bacterium]
MLAGCTAADSPLRRDMEQLAALPNQWDQALKARNAEAKAEAAAKQAELPAAAAAPTVQPSPAQPSPVLPPLLAKPPEPPPGYSPLSQPLAVENPLARPPWEAFAEAGPNANDELDLETLYGPGKIPAEMAAKDPDLQPTEQADAAVPETKPEAAATAKPGSTVITAVAVPQVTGARGKGNAELTAAMRKALKDAGWPVVNTPRKTALTVQGHVSMSPAAGGTQAVHLEWDVLSPEGHNLGNLKQDNQVPAGSLDSGWGASASDAAGAAAEGIFDLVQKYRN